MGLVIVGSLVTALYLLIQGGQIIRTGAIRPFFEHPDNWSDRQNGLGFGHRLAAASVYILPSVAIFSILTFALFNNGQLRVRDWLAEHGIGLLGGSFLLLYGLVGLLRPDVVLRWVALARPEYDWSSRGPGTLPFVRVLGAFVAILGLMALRSL